MIRTSTLLLAIAVGTWASDADDLAKRLVAASARAANPAGICVIPQGGPLVQAMVGASRFLVVGQENDAARMQASARSLADAGLLATRAYVVQAPPSASVLAERSATQLVGFEIGGDHLGETACGLLAEELPLGPAAGVRLE